jgi:FKBP-type peptidyl-prolyl cis-trans isomerase 2
LEGYGKNGDLKVPFWSTKDAGQKPFTFQIGMGNVIKGWDEGVAGMDLGETARVRSLLCFDVRSFSDHFIT